MARLRGFQTDSATRSPLFKRLIGWQELFTSVTYHRQYRCNFTKRRDLVDADPSGQLWHHTGDGHTPEPGRAETQHGVMVSLCSQRSVDLLDCCYTCQSILPPPQSLLVVQPVLGSSLLESSVRTVRGSYGSVAGWVVNNCTKVLRW